MENSNIEENDLIINSENEEITINNTSIDNEKYKSIIVKKSLKFKDMPFIIYPLILSGLLLIISIIVLLIIFSKYEIKYVYEKDAYIKPKYGSHNYSSVTFNNGLKLVLTQVDLDDKAGGSISFDYGYLDNKFAPGHFKLAFLSLISDPIRNSEPYKNYLGNFSCEVEKYYSSFYFDILGGGFQKYLKVLSTLTYIENKDERFNHIDNIDLTFTSSIIEKKNHLLEFLVYGYNDSKGRDIFPQGNDKTKKDLKRNYTKITNIMKFILSDPSKIKIVLYSHYKFSLMIKYFLKAFNIIAYIPKNNNNEFWQNAYNISKFTTNKIIYYPLNKFSVNFIEINYFLTNNVDYEQLIKDSQYLTYIIYILNQTDENSLYYELNNNENDDINIKSLSSNYEVVLKSKIKFSILIELNHYSYYHINDIISKVYNYINNIILYINSFNNNFNDIRIEELDKISEQNFTFAGNSHDRIFYKNLAIDLFYKDKKDILLKQMQFSKKDFLENITLVKYYFNQLTINNSVIFIGFSDFTKNKYNLTESEISYIFNGSKRAAYLNIRYSSNKLDEHIEPLYDNNYTKLLNPKKNEFISQFDSNSDLEYIASDYEDYFTKSYEEINEQSNNYIKVYWKKDTSFHKPRICATIYFFHPFMRPNRNDSDDSGLKIKDKLYFEYFLYYAYILRALTEQLADVFRAGNCFLTDHKENFIYLDLFFYSDIAEKAMSIFNNITSDQNKFIESVKNKFEIYKDILFEDIFLTNQDLNNMRHTFYQEITKSENNLLPPIYNHYNFPKEDFINIKYEDLIECDISLDVYSIKYIFLFGYYNKTDSMKIYQIFKMNNNIDNSLDIAGYTKTKIKSDNFVDWSLGKSLIKKNHNVTCSVEYYKEINRFMIFTEYSLKYSCLCEMLKYILKDDSNFGDNVKSFRHFNQKNIFLLYVLKNEIIDNDQFMNNIIKWLNNNKEMTNKVDVIGDRFYYLLDSFKKVTAIKHYNMIDSAWSITYDTLYNIKLEDNSGLNFKMEKYQDFIDEIKNLIKPGEKYIDIIPIKK